MTTAGENVAWCRSQLGYRESPAGSNRTKYHTTVRKPQGWAWCGIFLEAAAKATGLPLPGAMHYTPNGYAAFKRIGRVGTAPRVGAHIFVYYTSLGRIGHTGVVEAIDGQHVVTIEGNTNTSGSPTGVGVYRQRRRKLVPFDRRHTGIVAYGYPNYTGSSAGEEDDMPTLQEIQSMPVILDGKEYNFRQGIVLTYNLASAINAKVDKLALGDADPTELATALAGNDTFIRKLAAEIVAEEARRVQS